MNEPADVGSADGHHSGQQHPLLADPVLSCREPALRQNVYQSRMQIEDEQRKREQDDRDRDGGPARHVRGE